MAGSTSTWTVAHPEFNWRAAHLIFGQGCHAAFAWGLAHHDEGEDLCLDALISAYDGRVNAEMDSVAQEDIPVTYKKGVDAEVLQDRARSVLQLWLENYDLTEQPVEIERSFEVPLVNLETGETLPVPLVGVVDAVLKHQGNGAVSIIDWKTTTRTPGDREVDESLQLSAYAYWARQAGYGDHKVHTELRYLVAKKEADYQPRYGQRTDADLVRFYRVCEQVLRGISSGVFIPRRDGNWSCPDCEMRRWCYEW
ncbi:RecB family exonuclease [candidate division KSB1 bacterium]